MSNLYRGSSKDAFYQVSIHLVKRFQRRIISKIGQSETRLAYGGHVCKWIGQNEQSLKRTFHGCFLSSFTSFGWGVSEEKIEMWKVNGQQTMDAKWWQKLTLPLARWAKNMLRNYYVICYETVSKIIKYVMKLQEYLLFIEQLAGRKAIINQSINLFIENRHQ
jgi:hypothetical protein